jgi:hypothetical protein
LEWSTAASVTKSVTYPGAKFKNCGIKTNTTILKRMEDCIKETRDKMKKIVN